MPVEVLPVALREGGPAVFEHDEATNRLTIKPGQTPPWLRQSEHLPPGESNIWLYCEDGVFAFVVFIGLCKARRATTHRITDKIAMMLLCNDVYVYWMLPKSKLILRRTASTSTSALRIAEDQLAACRSETKLANAC